MLKIQKLKNTRDTISKKKKVIKSYQFLLLWENKKDLGFIQICSKSPLPIVEPS